MNQGPFQSNCLNQDLPDSRIFRIAITNPVNPFILIILIQTMASLEDFGEIPVNTLTGVFGIMPYEWDDANRRETLETRGIDFAEIHGFDWNTADTRRSYRNNEERQASLGMIGNRLYHVVWVWRGENRRIISLRKANEREEQAYYGD